MWVWRSTIGATPTVGVRFTLFWKGVWPIHAPEEIMVVPLYFLTPWTWMCPIWRMSGAPPMTSLSSLSGAMGVDEP